MANLLQKHWHDWRMREALLRYQDGELPAAQTQQLEHHLTNCPSCRQRLRSWEAAGECLTQQIPNRHRLAPQNAQSLFAAVRAQTELQIQYSQRINRRRHIGALAGACACIGVWMLYASTTGVTPGLLSARSVTVSSPPHADEEIAGNGRALRPSSGKAASSREAVLAGTPRIYVLPVASQNHDSQHRMTATTQMAFSRKRLGHRRNRTRAVEALLVSEQLRLNKMVSRHAPVPVGAAVDAGSGAERASEETDGALAAFPQDLRLLAQNLRGLPPDSHLIVTVTDDVEEKVTKGVAGEATAENSQAQSLPLKTASSDADAPGMAIVSALQVDDAGTQVWRVCSFGQNKEGTATVRYGAAWQHRRKPLASLTVMTETVPTEIVQGENK